MRPGHLGARKRLGKNLFSVVAEGGGQAGGEYEGIDSSHFLPLLEQIL